MSKGDLRYVAGLDPGDSTGLFVLKLPDLLSVQALPTVYARYQGQPSGALLRLESFIREAAMWQENVLIAAERFTTTDRTGKRSAQPTPQRVLGAAEQLSYQYTNVEFTLQAPADAKKMTDNWRLRDMGFYTRGEDVGARDSNDVNDAARHAVLALARRRASIFDLLTREADRRRGDSQR